jgi:hypothetical protein
MLAPPGAGKTTYVKGLEGAKVASADPFFVNPSTGKYEFNGRRLGEAHEFSKATAEQFMQNGEHHVVVDNTNTTPWQVAPYLQMAVKYGYKVVFTHLTAPADQIQRRGLHFPKDPASLQRLKGIKADADNFAAMLHTLKDHLTPFKVIGQQLGFGSSKSSKTRLDLPELHNLRYSIETIDTSDK